MLEGRSRRTRWPECRSVDLEEWEEWVPLPKCKLKAAFDCDQRCLKHAEELATPLYCATGSSKIMASSFYSDDSNASTLYEERVPEQEVSFVCDTMREWKIASGEVLIGVVHDEHRRRLSNFLVTF